MKSTKIIGVVQCKNEWGLIAVSISHALLNHVDEVYVLNDSSSDETVNGLKHLQTLWGNRLHIFSIKDNRYSQEAITNTVIHLAHKAAPDWIYVFDADEFLIVEGNNELKEILSGLDERQAAVRYQMENFISTSSFDVNNLDGYRKLVYKSIPRTVTAAAYNSIPEKVYGGELNFFDIPFLSKVIYRYSDLTRLKEGSHGLISFGNQGAELMEARIKSVHIPFPTRARLANKARHGEQLQKAGFPPMHGWQCQLIYKLESENRLGWFWDRHSIADGASGRAVSPSYVVDDTFSKAIGPTLDFLEKGFMSNNIACIGGKRIEKSTCPDTLIPIGEMVQLTAALQSQSDMALNVINKLQAGLGHAHHSGEAFPPRSTKSGSQVK